MIIDCHAHVSGPKSYWAYKAGLVSHRGSHGLGGPKLSDEEILAAWSAKEMAPTGHLQHMKACSIDMQFISPRPFQMMHSEKPAQDRQRLDDRDEQSHPPQLPPDAGQVPRHLRFAASAGRADREHARRARALREAVGLQGLRAEPRSVRERRPEAPPLGDEYWYPLYEKLVELDVVAHIHATGSREPEREPYTLHFINEETTAVYGLVSSTVLDDFPSLKILVSHGGGAMPYQIGRFDSASARGNGERFATRMRKLYYDTVLYTTDALELLIKTVGVDRVLYGAECPGVGSAINPETGLTFDNIVPQIRAIEWLSEHDKARILEHNARKLFKI